MKKLLAIIFLFGILTNNALAIDLVLDKEYKREQMIISWIEGEISEQIQNNQVVVKRNNVEIPVDHDLKKFGDIYYLWFDAPKSEGNYTIWLEDIKIMSGGSVKEISFSKNFTVGAELIDFQINPGFILPGEEFTLDIQNFKEEKINVDIDYPVIKTLTLNPGMNRFNFKIQYAKESKFISIGEYLLPISFLPNLPIRKNLSISSSASREEAYFIPSSIEGELFSGENKTIEVILSNKGNVSISEILFKLPKGVSVSPDKIDRLEVGKNASLNLTISLVDSSLLEETVEAQTLNSRILLDLSFKLVEGEEFNTTDPSKYRCIEISGGRKCNSDETCPAGKIVNASDGVCCTASCVVQENKTPKWIGILLAVIAIGILGYVYFRYKQTKKAEITKQNPIEQVIDKMKTKQIP